MPTGSEAFLELPVALGFGSVTGPTLKTALCHIRTLVGRRINIGTDLTGNIFLFIYFLSLCLCLSLMKLFWNLKKPIKSKFKHDLSLYNRRTNSLIDFNGRLSRLRVFYTKRLGNRVHCTFMFIFLSHLFLRVFFLYIVLLNTNHF